MKPGYRYISALKISFSPERVVGRLLSTFTPDFTFPTRREIAIADARKGLLLDAIYGDIDCQEEEAVQIISQTYRQFCAPVFRPCLSYAWVGAGYVDIHPGPLSTTTDYAFNEEEVVIPCQGEDCSSLAFVRQSLFTPCFTAMSAVTLFLITMEWTVIVAAKKTPKEEADVKACSPWLPLFNHGMCVRKYCMEVTFDEAEKSCVERGGHLPTICNYEDNSILGVFSLTHHGHEKPELTWIGYRRSEKDINKFEWTSGREGCNYTRWAKDQPDNAGGEEHCVHLESAYMYSYSDWNVISCDEKLFYMCEVPCELT